MAGARPPARHPKRSVPSQPLRATPAATAQPAAAVQPVPVTSTTSATPTTSWKKRLSAPAGANLIASIAAVIALGALIMGIVSACNSEDSADASIQSQQLSLEQERRSNDFAQKVEDRLVENDRRRLAELVTITTSTKNLPRDLIWVTVNNRGPERIRLPILEQDGATRTDPVVRMANLPSCTSRRFLVSRIWWNAKLNRPHLLYKDVNGRWWRREENGEVQKQKGSTVLRARKFEPLTQAINTNGGAFSKGDADNRSVIMPYNEDPVYCVT